MKFTYRLLTSDQRKIGLFDMDCEKLSPIVAGEPVRSFVRELQEGAVIEELLREVG